MFPRSHARLRAVRYLLSEMTDICVDIRIAVDSEVPIDTAWGHGWFMCVITHRRSIAERGGCFQRRLFVCLSVCLFICQHDDFRTIKRRMMKLGG